MDRTRAWLAVSPVVAAGVLAGHALAYRLTGAPSGAFHAYLDHAPQVLLALAVVGLGLGALGTRLRNPSPSLFALAAIATFAVQEHLERWAHTGDLPVLVTSQVFVVGLVLQVPVAVLAWALARRLLRAFEAIPVRRPTLRRPALELVAPRSARAARISVRPVSARGPPSALRR